MCDASFASDAKFAGALITRKDWQEKGEGTKGSLIHFRESTAFLCSLARCRMLLCVPHCTDYLKEHGCSNFYLSPEMATIPLATV